jgi:hypothetical protein
VHALTIRQEADEAMRHARDVRVRHAGDLDLRPLDDAAVVLAGCEEVVDPR